MRSERVREIVNILLAAGLILLFLFLFFKYLFLIILPFLIAWAIAFLTRPLAKSINKHIKLPLGIIRATLSILLSLAILAGISLIIWALGAELWRLLSGIGEGEALRELIDRITSGGILGGIFDSLGEAFGDIIFEIIISVARTLGTALSSVVTAVPRALIFILMTVIASVYFSLELEWVNDTVSRLLPKNILLWLSRFRRGFFSVGLSYIRAYLFLMLITFAVMLTGLVILRRPYALLLAFIIALLDCLPVIGVGTILIPWALYELVLGDSYIGIGLAVLFILYEIVRQFAEPRIVGQNLGIHPIITLILIYVGYSLFGIIGLLLVPIATVLVNIITDKNSDTAKEAEPTPNNE